MTRTVRNTLPGVHVCLRALVLLVALVLAPAAPVQAAERAKVEAFLEVTGFDVALDSIALSAASAPNMLGIDPGVFGADWTRLADQVFDVGRMHTMALEILEVTLEDDMLSHAAAFYASDLGQKLVVAENASHMMKNDEAKRIEGMQIIADLVSEGSPRVEMFNRMGAAIDASGAGLRAMQQIQLRFLLAASAAGVIEMQLDEGELTALMKSQEGAMLREMRQSSLANNAYTYKTFSDAEILEYVEALEQPLMQRVYELLNAVQYEITANRFEELARRMAELHPGQDI